MTINASLRAYDSFLDSPGNLPFTGNPNAWRFACTLPRRVERCERRVCFVSI